MKEKLILLVYLSVLLFIIHSCANRKTPTGGEKDIIGPKIISTYPKDKSINFNEREITFEFDEYIKEDKFFEKAIVSPALDTSFTFKVVKKELRLKFLKKFKENTTYTINLGEAIKDITEGNSGQDMSLTFSTGNYLDSLNISGEVFDIETGKGLENILISLYSATDTLSPFNSKPIYISRSNKEGAFVLQNIRKDKYFLYGWMDKDRNLKYTNQTEPIGFLSDTIKLDSSISKIKMAIQKFDLRKLKILRAETKEEGPSLEFNKGILQYSFTFADDSTKKILYTSNKEKNTFQLINTFDFKDSVFVKIFARDSFEIKTDTTIKVKFNLDEEKRKQTKKEEKKDEPRTFSIKYNIVNNQLLRSDEINLLFDYPIKTYTLDSIFFYRDSITTYPVKKEEISWNDNYTIMELNKVLDFRDTLKLFIGHGSFINVRSDSNRRVKQNFYKKNPSQFSSIGGEVQIPETDYIIQLVKKQSNQTLEIRNQKTFKFDYLEPGTYSIKVLIDENKNGVWDRGNLKERIEPERIIYFKVLDNKRKESNEITIKANWEILDNVIKESE